MKTKTERQHQADQSAFTKNDVGSRVEEDRSSEPEEKQSSTLPPYDMLDAKAKLGYFVIPVSPWPSGQTGQPSDGRTTDCNNTRIIFYLGTP